jgi:hypothetical protein
MDTEEYGGESGIRTGFSAGNGPILPEAGASIGQGWNRSEPLVTLN